MKGLIKKYFASSYSHVVTPNVLFICGLWAASNPTDPSVLIPGLIWFGYFVLWAVAKNNGWFKKEI